MSEEPEEVQGLEDLTIDAPDISPLEENIPTIGRSLGSSFTYYKIEITDTSKMLTILAEPCNEESDPDIYVSYGNPVVSQSTYNWKSTNIGPDKLQIHPDDPEYREGTYYVGILSYKPGLNTFQVTYSLTDTPQSTELEETYSGVITDSKFFKFRIENPGESRIEIRLNPGKGKLAMFVSKELYYPSIEEHQWSLGFYESLGLVDDDYMLSSETYIDPDPYDVYLKRNFSRKPTSRELDRLATLPKSENEEEIGEELRFCIDTDEWKYSNQMCFLGIKNLTEEPIDFTIERREVLESSLISDELSERFKLFNSIFENIEGSSISQMERKRLNVGSKSEFTYGEIDFVHMAPVFKLCDPQPGEVFWDLGCGAGKCMLAAALAFPELKKCCGVELLPGLYESCKATCESIKTDLSIAPLEVVQGNMLEVDWSDADIIFTSSICFPQELIDGMLEKAHSLKKGARFITLKTFPQNDIFEVKYNLRVKMTWGKTGVYILVRN